MNALSFQSIHSDGFPYAHLRAIAEAVNRVAHPKFLQKSLAVHDRTTYLQCGSTGVLQSFPKIFRSSQGPQSR